MKHLHLVHQNGNDVFSWGAPGCEDLGMNHHLQVHLTGTRRSRVLHHCCWWWTFQWQLDWETQSSAIGTESSLEKASQIQFILSFSSFSFPPPIFKFFDHSIKCICLCWFSSFFQFSSIKFDSLCWSMQCERKMMLSLDSWLGKRKQVICDKNKHFLIQLLWICKTLYVFVSHYFPRKKRNTSQM